MSLPFLQDQLQVMVWLTSHRIGWLNPFFKFLNYFDTTYFSFFLIPLVWLALSPRWGLRMFYLMLCNLLVNGALKMLFGWPRPNQLIPEIAFFQFKSPGFPSGGAQTALLLGAVLMYYGKTRAAWVVGLAYIALISFSRLYIGVHFPLDVLGGWAVASILFYLFTRWIDPFERFLHLRGLEFCLGLSLSIPLLLYLSFEGTELNSQIAAAFAVAIGSYLSFKHGFYLEPSRDVWECAKRGMYAIALPTLLLAICLRGCMTQESFIIAVWVSLVASPIYRRFFMSR